MLVNTISKLMKTLTYDCVLVTLIRCLVIFLNKSTKQCVKATIVTRIKHHCFPPKPFIIPNIQPIAFFCLVATLCEDGEHRGWWLHWMKF
jgi:hypothetical protein